MTHESMTNVPPAEFEASATSASGAAVVCAADRLAAQAGVDIVAAGGNAVDAALATNAVMAVVAPHMCGMGGDLFALVHTPDGKVYGLNSSGPAGSRIEPDRLRAEGYREMPFRHHPASVTVPGCVDGWVALADRFGSLPLDEVFAAAIDFGEHGFPASPLLVRAVAALDDEGRHNLHEVAAAAQAPGAVVHRAGVARALREIAGGGRGAFYEGEFGAGLVGLDDSPVTPADLSRSCAEWVEPLATNAFGVELLTIGPNSQGYLALAAAAIADRIGPLPLSGDVAWVHRLAEAAKLASYDRPDVLFDGADGARLITAALGRADRFDPTRATDSPVKGSDGDTTYLCTAGGDGMAVSLIQSNASGFGSWLVEPNTQINLHNRGIGFNLIPGHPAELTPGRRPPHTLLPAMARRDGRLAAVFGTMGGDAQPQIVLQIAARLFAGAERVADTINAPRWAWRGPVTGFDTWTAPDGPLLTLEGGTPTGWVDELEALGHRVATTGPLDSSFGHAHAIVVDDGEDRAWRWSAAADPRCVVGAAIAVDPA